MEWPSSAFGTMEGPGCGAEEMGAAVRAALEAGVRAVDTAEMYASLPHVGRALAESGVPREQLFVVSKLTGLPVGDYAAVRARAQAVLDALGVRRVDALLVHFPASAELDMGAEPRAERMPWSYFAENVSQAWKNMLQLRADGLCAHVGVSNFYAQHLAELRRLFPEASDQPAVNQIYIDAVHQERDFVREMQQSGVRVMAYRPLAFCGVLGMIEDAAAQCTALTEAEGHASMHEAVLAWLARRGVCAVWRSASPEHVKANAAAAAGGGGSVDEERWAALDGNEMVDMYGGCDEFAAAFRAMQPSPA